ncbi:hypothetical protein SDC9_79544 [bioreactor metagenome]|uniref:Uncharacterized protein n=1 Tax=bioreactor metagenome TaxID=1076179 RepID=A0A644YX74_9ZZZZ
MPKLGSILVSAAIVGFSLPAMAVLPQAGLWTIGNELNGEPGRGIQLDRQGGQTIVLSYFGYREDGSSMFLQAGGKMKDGKTFTGNLVEYKNGIAVGGTARTAELAKDYGAVTVTFDSSVSGTITLPGEQSATFSRFTYEDLSKRLNGKFPVTYTPLEGRNGEQYKGSLTLTAEEGVLKAEFSIITDPNRPYAATTCTYEGDLVPAGYAFRSAGTRICDGDLKASNFRFEDLHVNEYSELRGRSYLKTARQGEILQLISGLCMSSENTTFAQMYCNATELGLTDADIAE